MMRCIVMALGGNPALFPLINYKPSPLLKILDKPLLAHALEMLCLSGIKEVHLLLHYLPSKIELYAEDGKRWGIKLYYHLVKNSLYPFQAIRPLALQWKDEKVLIGNLDNTPFIEKKNLEQIDAAPLSALPIIFISNQDEKASWGVISSNQLSEFSSKTELNQFYNDAFSFSPEKNRSTIQATPFINCETLVEYQKTNLRLITEIFAYNAFPSTAKMIEPGIILSRAVELHPRVEIIPPIFIGEDCQIKSAVKLGPNAVIENHCLIDSESCIANSLVCERSYVGEGLEVNNSIVSRNTLINLTFDSILQIRDDFILSEMKGPSFARRFFGKALQWLTALIGIIFCLPLFLFMFATCRFQKKQVIKIPVQNYRDSWESFELMSFCAKEGKEMTSFQNFFSTLPYFIHILKGEMHFAGLPPRTLFEVESLPEEWRIIYLKGKAGWVSLWDVEKTKSTYDIDHSLDEQYACEAYYCTKSTVWRDLKILIDFFLTKFGL